MGGAYYGLLTNTAGGTVGGMSDFYQNQVANALYGSGVFTNTMRDTLALNAPYEAKARPRTNLEWLDDDIKRYRVPLAA